MTAPSGSLNDPSAGIDESVLLDEAQLLLAEKRTSLSTIRTGIALFALPLTILSALIATSRLYDPSQVLHFLVPVLVVCAFLLLLAGYLTVRALIRLRRHDRMLEELRADSPRLARMLD